uniref:GILT-like protein C02D5.2 n=1 Tax=Plectus sambesii TaxID=2011161 RepID=A0A914WSP6_9BILA
MISNEKRDSPKRPLLVVDTSILAESLQRRKGGCMVRNSRQWLYCLLALIVVVVVYRWLVGRAAYEYDTQVKDFDQVNDFDKQERSKPEPLPPFPDTSTTYSPILSDFRRLVDSLLLPGSRFKMIADQISLTCFCLLLVLCPLAFGHITLSDAELRTLECIFHPKPNCTMLQKQTATSLFRKAVDLPTRASAKSIVNLDAYIEAKCPDTTRFVQSQLWPTWQKLGKSARFHVTLIPFGKARCHPKDDDFQCDCQHGPNECILNQLMNCLIEAHPRTETHLPHIRCIQGKQDLNDARASCLEGRDELNLKRLMECADGPRGRRLLALAGEKTQALNPKMYFVPWTVVDGKRTEAALDDLTALVCSRLTDPKLEECH